MSSCGKYPLVDSKHESLPPSGLPDFTQASVEDGALAQMGYRGKPAKPTSVKLNHESVKRLARDQRVALSSLSYALWSIRAISHVLSQLAEQAPANASLGNAVDLLTASRRWLLIVGS